MEDIKVLSDKSKSTYFSSIVFLVVVVVITVLLYLYNNYLKNNILDIQNTITTVESSINEVENDKNIQIYRLIQLNKEVIASYESMNNITKYINNLNILEREYNLDFTGFEISKGEISTSVITSTDQELGAAYQKTRDFIKKYREDKKALFDLAFITSVEGMVDMKFNVNFKIKNNLTK
ncbi:MAG: hypothetical protein Q8K30_00670 [Candidatus Gracilibacteria bacterium]|nr:hypothetical protein [Candidatus Gracilibacteria bacterium]